MDLVEGDQLVPAGLCAGQTVQLLGGRDDASVCREVGLLVALCHVVP